MTFEPFNVLSLPIEFDQDKAHYAKIKISTRNTSCQSSPASISSPTSWKKSRWRCKQSVRSWKAAKKRSYSLTSHMRAQSYRRCLLKKTSIWHSLKTKNSRHMPMSALKAALRNFCPSISFTYWRRRYLWRRNGIKRFHDWFISVTLTALRTYASKYSKT